MLRRMSLGQELSLRSPHQLTFLVVEAMDLMGKAMAGSAAAVQPPYLSQLFHRDSYRAQCHRTPKAET